MSYVLPATVAIIALISLYLSPKAKTTAAFFNGTSALGHSPSLTTLVLSQVTTWIFARSLLNAAILGYYYGAWGTIAYAAYYLSFFSGSYIVDALRFKHGASNVQSFLISRFGTLGGHCYNLVISLRLISEVFANILVIAILFGAEGTTAYTLAVAAFAMITLCYSLLGGLHASLKTDVAQMLIFIAVLVVLMMAALFSGNLGLDTLFAKPFVINEPGPILILVALLQVGSYPMHDPVMMDRGFLADRITTRKSFNYAGFISIICILAFGSLGIMAGVHALDGETMNSALTRLLGEIPFLLFNIALIISAMSTLDSTLASSSKLIVKDMGLFDLTIQNGRLVMVIFMLLGVSMVFLNNKDLFSAVAVSGTASMYLLPVIVFSIWLNKSNVPQWSYLASFCIAIGGAALYFTESSGHSSWLGDAHKYTKLLYICLAIIVVSFTAFILGMATQAKTVTSSAK